MVAVVVVVVVVVMMVAFSLLARSLGECLTIHSLSVLLCVFVWRLACAR